MFCRRAMPIALAATMWLVCARANASAPAEEARAAYERGTKAYDSKDFALAAREFARADTLVPSNAAIEAALEASLKAGDPVLGMELVDRARARPLDDRAATAASRVASAYEARIGRLVFPCEKATSCRGFVDGVEVERPHAPVVVVPGRHTVRVVRDERFRETVIDVTAGATSVVPSPESNGVTAPSSGAVSPSGGGASRERAEQEGRRSSSANTIVTLATGGLTLVAGGLSIASYVDLRAKRDEFERGACGVDASPLVGLAANCEARADRGKDAELRTGILVGATAALALTTAAFVIFRPFETKARASALPGGAALALEGKLP